MWQDECLPNGITVRVNGAKSVGSLLCSGVQIRPETLLFHLRGLICGATRVSHQSTHAHKHTDTHTYRERGFSGCNKSPAFCLTVNGQDRRREGGAENDNWETERNWMNEGKRKRERESGRGGRQQLCYHNNTLKGYYRAENQFSPSFVLNL